MYETYDPGMFWAVFGALWIFCCTGVLIIIWHLRGKRRIEKLNLIHQERMRAMEKGIPLPEFPELDEEQSRIELRFERLNVSPKWPLGLGALFIMSGIGVCAAFMLSNDAEFNKLWSMGLIGVFFGIGLAGYYALTRTTKR